MKVLHILYSGLGGHGNVFFSLVQADVDNEFEYEALFNGIEEVKPEYVLKCNEIGMQWNFVKKTPGLDIAYYKEIAKIVKISAAGIIFLHSSSYILPAKIGIWLGKKKKKIIVRETQANHLKSKMEWFWLFIALLLADKIVFLTNEYKSQLKKRFKFFLKEHKTSIVPNGINLANYLPGSTRKKNEIIIGMQSRLIAIKDHTTLLKAFSILKTHYKNISLKLVIAGDGETRSILEHETKNLGIENNVQFTGMLNEKELILFMKSLSIYVHASLGETMSTAIMQAMACGLPIVGSDVPGINNMITQNHTGILVTPKQPKQMFNAFQQLIENPLFAEKLVSNALKFANENYSNKSMFAKYKTIFKNLNANNL